MYIYFLFFIYLYLVMRVVLVRRHHAAVVRAHRGRVAPEQGFQYPIPPPNPNHPWNNGSVSGNGLLGGAFFESCNCNVAVVVILRSIFCTSFRDCLFLF